MGPMIIIVWIVNAAILALPGVALAVWLTLQRYRRAAYLAPLVVCALGALYWRLDLVFGPYVETGTVPVWPAQMALAFSQPLLITVALAVAAAATARVLTPEPTGIEPVVTEPAGGRPADAGSSALVDALAGSASGLAVSVAAQTVLALFCFGSMVDLLGLTASY